VQPRPGPELARPGAGVGLSGRGRRVHVVPGADRTDPGDERGDLRRRAAVTVARRRGPCAQRQRGLRGALAAEVAAKVAWLVGAVAASMADSHRLEAAELAIRAGLTRRGVLEDLLAAGPATRT
jgi:hypothetical protein